MSKYSKLIAALVGAAVLFIGQYYGQTSQVYSVVVSLATAFGVYLVPNKEV